MATNSKFSADLGIQTDADLQVDGNVTVSGNLTVNGTQTTVNSTTTSVEDSMLELANANLSSDTLDIGIYGNYDDGLGDGVSEYTGFFRDASDSTWKLFDGLEAEPTTTVNTSGTGYTLADLQVGDLTATTLTATNALTGSSITYPTSDGTNGQVLKTNGSGVLSFGDIPAGYTDSDVESYLNSETNLGIGTTSPDSTLHVKGVADAYLTLEAGATDGNTALLMQNSGGTQEAYILYDTDDNNMQFGVDSAERMRLNNAGDAHIGLNDNDVQLFLGSVGGAFGGNSSNNVRASDSNLMLNTPGQFIVEKSGSLGILMDTDKSFYVRPATSSDNFGMYVRTSNSADTGMLIGRTGTNNAQMGVKVSSNGSNSYASFKFAISDATTWSSDDWFKLKVSGEMDGNFNDTSDQNLKENIVSIPNGDLAKVMQLNPVTFDWKNAVSRNDQTGFIAQEVETIFPNEVLGDAYDVEVEGSGKSINTIGLLSHTVKALQELKTLVDTLETRITTLEG